MHGSLRKEHIRTFLHACRHLAPRLSALACLMSEHFGETSRELLRITALFLPARAPLTCPLALSACFVGSGLFAHRCSSTGQPVWPDLAHVGSPQPAPVRLASKQEAAGPSEGGRLPRAASEAALCFAGPPRRRRSSSRHSTQSSHAVNSDEGSSSSGVGGSAASADPQPAHGSDMPSSAAPSTEQVLKHTRGEEGRERDDMTGHRQRARGADWLYMIAAFAVVVACIMAGILGIRFASDIRV
jgi:hypothetical protein